MHYKLPKLTFDQSRFMSLSDGFHRTGQIMFPEEWTGLELTAWPTDDPADLARQNRRLKNSYDRAVKHAFELKTQDTTNIGDEDALKYETAVFEANEKARQARQRLDQFGQTFDSRHKSALAFERRDTVEAKLCAAIAKGELELFYGHGIWTDWKNHMRTHQVHLSFKYSFVVWPKGQFSPGRQRHQAHFERDDYSRWAQPMERNLEKYRIDSIEDQLIDWFKMRCTELQLLNERPTKERLLKESCTRFDVPYDNREFERKFKAVWQLFAPAEWTKGGKPGNL